MDGPACSGIRANPCPEVTDLVCRLPLPTLFYSLEAVNLGDLLRIWVRAGKRWILAQTRIFTGRQQRAGQRKTYAALRPTRFPFSGRADSGDCVPHKEERTLPGATAVVSELACVAACRPPATGASLCARREEVCLPGAGMFACFPFAASRAGVRAVSARR